MKNSFVGAVVAALALVQTCAPALAQSAADQLEVAISTSDLDLESAKGVRALDRRILTAASDLCGIPYSADPHGRADYRNCRDRVRSQAASARNQAISRATARRERTVTASR
jgi:UrcA family protein